MLQSTIYNFSANVISYNGDTRVAILDAATPVDVSLGYNTVLGSLTSTYSITGNNVSLLSAIQHGSSNAAALSTDENGNFYGVFNLPASTFYTGQRILRVDNRTSPADAGSATTFSQGTFTATSLATVQQQSNFSPSVDSKSTIFTPIAAQANRTIETISNFTQFDPVAQSFIIDKNNYPNGIFLYSLKLFFAKKPKAQNAPVTVSIVPTLNGYPNGNALAYSTVIKYANEIKTSATPHYLDNDTGTQFVFDAPVYIQAGVTYAILVQTSSPDYQVYLAQQNATALNSTARANPQVPIANTSSVTQIGAAPYTGAFFESQNGVTWTADLTKDLMFVLDQCVFNTSVTPQINFTTPYTLPKRKFLNNDIQYSLDPTVLSGIYSSAGGDQRVDAINVTTTDFIPTNTAISYAYTGTIRDTMTPDGPWPISPGKFGSPTPENVYLDDGKGPRYLATNSNSSFILTATMTSTDSNVSPILSDDGISLYNIRYAINNMGLSNPVISVANVGSGYSNTTSAVVSAPDIGTNTATVSVGLSGNTIANVVVTYGGSGYLTTPTITIVDPLTRGGNANAVIAVSGETGQNGGNGLSKYFTKKVVLAPGNDAGDLRVFLTAYRPPGTNIFVYYKILSSLDTQRFEQSNWQLMTQIGNQNIYSSDRTNFIEYAYAPGIFSSGNANNFISYLSTNGQVYNKFNQFAIKIVMASSDTTRVPMIDNMIAMALPSGTGA